MRIKASKRCLTPILPRHGKPLSFDNKKIVGQQPFRRIKISSASARVKCGDNGQLFIICHG